MSNKLFITAIASLLTLSIAAQAPAQTIKKKKVVKPSQSEENAGKEVMDALVLGVATGMLTGAMKKGKMPKGTKLIMKQGLKAVKNSAKKSKDGGKKDSGSKDALKLLFGG
ncbi:MAG: hypothetical protein KL863_15015 [Rhizobium sp.]|nr:hypothetical protein [Rhizobium sp.]